MQIELKIVDILFVDNPTLRKFAEMNRMGSRERSHKFKEIFNVAHKG